MDACDIVVLDEFGSNLDLHPTHAWAPIGERAFSDVPRNTPINTTTIASLSAQGMGPAMVVEGGVDRLIFTSYLEQVLAPSLRPGQLVLLDNLSAHKSSRVKEIIAACGCTLVYLPPYSPDYSPIELAFAKIKAALRHAAARTREALQAAIATALSQITAADARAFFLHCGYRFLPNMDQWFCSSLYRRDEADLKRAQKLKDAAKNAQKWDENRHRKKALAHIHERIANRRSDFAHKRSRELVNTYQVIVFEDLEPQQMGVSKGRGMRKSIMDVAWSQFVSMTISKAEEAGRLVILVNPRDTSKMCSHCGELVEKKLSERTHTCPHCGLVMDRDKNAALNILHRGLQTLRL